jgi:hypothetical protein
MLHRIRAVEPVCDGVDVMRDRASLRRATGAFLIPLILLVVACGSSSSVVVRVGTPTATTPRATATPSGPPPHAFAWTQYDSAGVAQVWASVNGATPVQLSHAVANTVEPCATAIAYGLPVVSPDLSHVVAVQATATCGDGPLVGAIHIMTVASTSAAVVPGTSSSARANMRATGWVDDHTIFFAGDQLYTYTLGAAAPTPLAGVTNAAEAVVRGHTLYYMQVDTASLVLTFTLHRYDLATNSALPGAIAMGQMHMCQCSPGDFPMPGWDVSRDGAHVVYQQTTPAAAPNFGIASSHIIYADADGGHPTAIAQALSTTNLLRMQLSPNGQLVAINGVMSTAPVVSASVSSAGLAGDPNYHTYTPDALGFPVWKWDNSSFWAATQSDSGAPGASIGALDYYQVGTASAAVGVAGGYNPWYTLP